MKKIAIFFTFIIMIVVGISYMYINYQNNRNKITKENSMYESYYNQEIKGTNLATIINKAMDTNTKNEVGKDSKGKYINNENNSINIDIKMLDDGNTYNMEKIFNGGISTFTAYYSEIKFKCTQINYHSNTGRISYLFFEQITQ